MRGRFHRGVGRVPQSRGVAFLRRRAAPREQEPDALYQAAEAARILGIALACCPLKHVQLIGLRYGTGLTFAAIAMQWGVSESAVSAMHRRAIRNLRSALRARGITSLSELL